MVLEISRQLSVSQQTLRNWINKDRNNGLAASRERSVPDLEAALPKLRKDLADVRGSGSVRICYFFSLRP